MGKKNTLCKYRKMGRQEYVRAHEDILDESSASTRELSGKELSRGGG